MRGKPVFHLCTRIAIAAICVTILGECSIARSSEELLESRRIEMDGDFTLTDHLGKPFQLKQQRGKIALLFFGYTSCAEACPVAMAKMASVYKKLAKHKSKVITLFISVDPQRDSTRVLEKYLDYFALGAIGLTGKREEIDRVVKQYGAWYEIEKSDSALGYHINHSTYLYAIAPDGKVRFRFHHTDKPELIASGVEALMQ